MSSPTEIKQFSKSQYDMPSGAMACSAIAMVAGTKFLKYVINMLSKYS